MIKPLHAVTFPQATMKVVGDNSTTQALPACIIKDTAITCWRIPFLTRIWLLFTGKLWIWTIAPTPPCMSVDVEDPFSGSDVK